MQQFEEQMDAARIVTPLTRPINLYYGLMQAGIAIQAVYADNPWSFSRHGLKLDNFSLNIGDLVVKPEGNGAFQAVSDTVGSQRIEEPVQLGALWASLPDLRDAKLRKSDPAALHLMIENWGIVANGRYPRASVSLETSLIRSSAHEEDPLGHIRTYLRNYPALNGTIVVGTKPAIETWQWL